MEDYFECILLKNSSKHFSHSKVDIDKDLIIFKCFLFSYELRDDRLNI